MLYDYLHEFSVVAQEDTLSAAADKLNLSQPSLGRHLAALETLLGVKLVNRSSEGIHLTEDGRYTLDIALDVAALGQSMAQHFSSEERRSHERRLLVGILCDSQSVMHAISEGASRLNARGYNITVRYMQPYSLDSIAASLSQRETDIIIAYESSVERSCKDGTYASVPLLDVSVAVVLNPSHPLASRTDLSIDDVKGFHFLRKPETQSGQAALWCEFRKRCEAAGFKPSSQELRYSSRYGFEVRRPDEVDICCLDSPDTGKLRSGGQVVTPISGISLPVSAIMRDDDTVAMELVEQARAVIEGGDAHEAADHQSIYGATAKNDARGDKLTLENGGRLYARVIDEPDVTADLILPDGTVVDKVYVALRNRLNRMSDGLNNDPVDASYEAIMKLWSVEDARAELEMPTMQWFTAYDYSVRSGRELDECEKILNRFSSRNLVYRVYRGGIERYCLLPWVYGIWEFSVRNYDQGFLNWGIFGSDVGSRSQYPVMHVCPVSKRAVKDGHIAAYRDWEGYIRRQSKACVAPCQCRRSQGIEGIRSCNDDEHPMEVCFTFGEMAEYWIEEAGGKEIGIDECLSIARKAVFEHGLIPQLYFSQNPEVMCFCHSDCCYVLSAIKATGGTASSMPNMSAYMLEYDKDACVGCGTCVKWCPMGAITMEDDGHCVTAPTCVACGQCALHCPSGARILVEKDPADICQLPDDLPESYRWRAEDRMAKGYISDFTGARLDTWIGMP